MVIQWVLYKRAPNLNYAKMENRSVPADLDFVSKVSSLWV